MSRDGKEAMVPYHASGDQPIQWEAIRTAYESLSDDEKQTINGLANVLMDIKRVGPETALEIIGAVGIKFEQVESLNGNSNED